MRLSCVESRASDLLPFTYTPLWLVDDLKREKPLNNQLQPLTSKTDKKLFGIFMNTKPNSKNRSTQSNFSPRAPVCFVGTNIEFFAREMS